ncbi:MAG: SDR family oxidoreductase, partial [Chloroflexota bacterium]
MGLGEATARLLAGEGARVALVARSADTLARLTAELPDSLALPTDLRDAAAIIRMVAAVHAHFGRIDVLINNAGQAMHGPIERVDLAQYRRLLDLNLYAPLLAMQAVIPIMREQAGGMILNVSSLLTTLKMYLPGLGAYEATKHALNVITLTARAELAADNIRVGLIYPGMMATEFGAHALAASSEPRGGAGQGPMRIPAGAPLPDVPEAVAAKILEVIKTAAAEQF